MAEIIKFDKSRMESEPGAVPEADGDRLSMPSGEPIEPESGVELSPDPGALTEGLRSAESARPQPESAVPAEELDARIRMERLKRLNEMINQPKGVHPYDMVNELNKAA